MLAYQQRNNLPPSTRATPLENELRDASNNTVKEQF